MYAAAPDPYCYPGTSVLKNTAGLRDQADLDAFEAVMVTQRLDEPLPSGRLSYSHYRAIHRHLFGDVYPWAGRIRRVRIAKGDSMFCYPEHIDRQMRTVFKTLHDRRCLTDMTPDEFAAAAAHVLSEINAIHPFREGNGRTQLAFLTLLAHQAHHPLALARLDPRQVLDAMIASFGGNEAPLRDVIRSLI
jgi:cell filamentation protein